MNDEDEIELVCGDRVVDDAWDLRNCEIRLSSPLASLPILPECECCLGRSVRIGETIGRSRLEVSAGGTTAADEEGTPWMTRNLSDAFESPRLKQSRQS